MAPGSPPDFQCVNGMLRRVARQARRVAGWARGGTAMKHCRFSIGAMVVLVGLTIPACTALAAGRGDRSVVRGRAPGRSGWTSDGELIGRVQKVVPGAQQFQVLDRTGNQIQVVWPARPPQATRIYRDGSLVNTSAL